MNEFYFSPDDSSSAIAISKKLFSFLKGEIPVVVCIGTDALIGDSLGPIVGTMLESERSDLFVYGALNKTITAKEVKTVTRFLSKVHKDNKVLVIDAAVGNKQDVGKIKISDAPIKPGLGADKELPALGDVSIVSVISERSKNNYIFSTTPRLSPIFSTAKIIAEAIELYVTAAKDENISRAL